MNALINIDVDDITKAEAFYTAAFGLRPGRRFGLSGIELLGLKCPIYLLLKEEGSRPFKGATMVRTFRRHWSPVHLDFEVPDIEAALKRTLAAGAVLENEIAQQRWGKIAMLSDPFGNGFCLIQFTGGGYDEIAD